jgi:hypothetical protein
MSVGLIVKLCFWLFAAIVISIAVLFIVIEMLDKVESLKEKVPWITKILEKRSALVALLLICVVLLVGDGYEYLTKEVPDVPSSPSLTFPAPPAPKVTIYQLSQPIKEQCWINNYAVPAFASPQPWGLTTIMCNTTIKPPYSVQLTYDQNVEPTPFAFPVGSEFAKSQIFNGGTKVTAMFDLHTIIPNEPFSIMARGSTDNFPLVKSVTIRARGVLFEFHP